MEEYYMKRKEKLKKSEYESIYDCIVSDQVPADAIAKYFEDKDFYSYYTRRKNGYQRSVN